MRKRAILTALILGMAVSACSGAMIVEGYLRAPGIVAAHVAAHPILLQPRDVPADRIRELLIVEDPRFYSHFGVDFTTPGAGMTTITQGLVKFLYFDRFRPGLAKFRQSLLAIGFDARVDKQTQLAIFLNSGNLGTLNGRNVRGFSEGAQVYFGKPFAELSRAEYLSLVAMCIGPNEFSVATHLEKNSGRVRRIERLLRGECRPAGWRDVYYASCDVRL